MTNTQDFTKVRLSRKTSGLAVLITICLTPALEAQLMNPGQTAIIGMRNAEAFKQISKQAEELSGKVNYALWTRSVTTSTSANTLPSAPPPVIPSVKDPSANLNAALPVLSKATADGIGEAAAYLGVLYEYGLGKVTQDDAKAVAWYLKAVDAGVPIAMNNLAFLYEGGRGGLRKDFQKAANLYLRAANAGYSRAMTNFGVLCEDGRGVPEDQAKAFLWFQKAAAAGDPYGMTSLGNMYLRGEGGAPQDDDLARTWLTKAAEAGDGLGMTMLGYLYRSGEGGLPHDDAQAVFWYRKGAEAGDTTGMNNLAGMYRDGLGGLRHDCSEAVNWYRKAIAAGDDVAMYNLGIMYEVGCGVPRSLTEASNWYAKAARLDNEQAREALKRLRY